MHFTLVGCLGAVLLFVALSIYVIVDSSPPDDSALMLPPLRSVEEEDSVIAGLEEILRAIPEAAIPEMGNWIDELSMEDTLDGPTPFAPRPLHRTVWTAEDASVIEAFFTDPGVAIEGLDDVLARPFYGEPVPEDMTSGSPGQLDAREISRFEFDRALAHRIRRDHHAAAEALDRVQRLAVRMRDEGASIVTILTGVSLSTRSLEALISLLHDGELTPEVERRLLGLPTGDAPSTRAVRALRLEYGVFRRTLEKIAEGELEDIEGRQSTALRAFLKQNRTLRRGAEGYELLLEWVRTPRWLRGESALAPFFEGARVRATLTANVGEILIPLMMQNLEPIIGRFEILAIQERAVATLVALRIHERTFGTLPPDLGTLVGTVDGYDAVSIDPYSGEPLRYDRERRIIWSVGENGTDEGAPDLEAWLADPFDRLDDSSYFRFDVEYSDWIWVIPPLPDEDDDR